MSLILKMGERQQQVPEGEYQATIIEIKETSYLGKRRTLNLVFEIKEGKFFGNRLNGFVNAHYDNFSEHSKLWKWYSIITNITPDPGDDFNLEEMKNFVVLIRVKNKESRKTKNVFSNVDEIIKPIIGLE